MDDVSIADLSIPHPAARSGALQSACAADDEGVLLTSFASVFHPAVSASVSALYRAPSKTAAAGDRMCSRQHGRNMAILAMIASAWACPSTAGGTQVTIRVLNVSAARGVIRVAFCRELEWEKQHCSYGGRAAAIAGVTEVRVDVAPGVYGVLVHHDANSDNLINRNGFGFPTEGVGFSRNARMRFGYPAFSAVSMPIAGDNASASVSLIFEPSSSVSE